jgi:predicted AAA+ superfamily ATPase
MKQHIKRKLEKTIGPYLKEKEVLAIVGPRQSGKTTLLHRLKAEFNNPQYINFEDEELAIYFEDDPKGFYQQYGLNRDCLLLDEFQYIKRGGKRLKLLFDEYPKTKYIISGSSSLDLLAKTGKYLVGRMLTFPLFPLSFAEFLLFKDADAFNGIYQPYQQQIKKAYLFKKNKLNIQIHPTAVKQINKYLSEYIIFGGYPRVVMAKNDALKKKLLKGIVDTYFLKDIKGLLALATGRQLRSLLKALALQIGNVINYNELSGLSNFDFTSLKKHLHILEETFIAVLVSPYFTNKRSELTKNPKVYFFDSGLRNSLLEDFSDVEIRVDKGALLENFVYEQLFKKELTTKFWRTKSGAEVDFVIEKGKEVLPIEVKNLSSPNKLGKSLISFIKKYRPAAALLYNHQGNTWQRKYQSCTTYSIPLFLA